MPEVRACYRRCLEFEGSAKPWTQRSGGVSEVGCFVLQIEVDVVLEVLISRL